MADGDHLRRMVTEELFRRAAQVWERYKKARGDLAAQREAYELFVRILRPLFEKDRKAVEVFLRKTEGMPVRAVLRRLAG